MLNPASVALLKAATASVLIAAALVAALMAICRPAWLIRHLLAAIIPQVLFCGPADRRQLALTIDDGPTPSGGSGQPGSDALLALLRDLRVPATFFLIGAHLREGCEAFVVQALADGHSVAPHMDRDGITALLPAQVFAAQLDRCERQLEAAGGDRPLRLRWFRPGGGWFHPGMLRAITARGYRLVLGTVWPWDTLHPPLAWQRWFVLVNAHPGAILVLHDRPDTLAATLSTLRSVVPQLRRRGYTFVPLDVLAGPVSAGSGTAGAESAGIISSGE